MKLTVREAAAMLNVAETQVYRWVDDEEIPFVMLHHQPRFHRLELLEWAMERELAIGVDLYEDDRDQPFAHALERGGGRVLGGDLADIAGDLPLSSASGDAASIDDRELIRAVLGARDGAVFVHRAGDGIAVPRAHSPIIIPAQPAALTLWWCDPVQTISNVVTRALFLIVAPTIKQHLQLLSRLSLALHDRELCAAVLRKGEFRQLLAEARRWEHVIEGGSR